MANIVASRPRLVVLVYVVAVSQGVEPRSPKPPSPLLQLSGRERLSVTGVQNIAIQAVPTRAATYYRRSCRALGREPAARYPERTSSARAAAVGVQYIEARIRRPALKSHSTQQESALPHVHTTPLIERVCTQTCVLSSHETDIFLLYIPKLHHYAQCPS